MLLTNLSFLPKNPSGLSVYATNLLSALDLPDIQVLSNQAIAAYPCHAVPPSISSDFAYPGLFKRLLWTQFQIPRLYSHLQANLFFSPIPEAPLGVKFPTIITVHDVIPLHFPRLLSRLRLYFKYYVSQVVRAATHVICDSTTTARDLKDLLGVSVRNVSVIPLAYDSSNFRCLNLPRKNYFLYVGRHDDYKNLPRLITAFAHLKDQDLTLKIAGSIDGKNTPALKQQAQELGVSDCVEFLTYVPYSELPTLINQAIALVFPSLWEGFGLPVLEAMACGTPVITSNLSSLP
ncbi:MAG: glycosyltransferase family 4 protein, partial [Spirulina sp. SIO3F2]|nr:glycosyltransferase family 4 protein [Spirulina sp. SIO3F2]